MQRGVRSLMRSVPYVRTTLQRTICGASSSVHGKVTATSALVGTIRARKTRPCAILRPWPVRQNAPLVPRQHQRAFSRTLADSSNAFHSMDDPGFRVWVPNIVSPHATWAYSWIRPPSRSRRRTRILAPAAGGPWRPAGGFWCSVLCGR
jgi:hypothetical protein